VKVFSEMTEEDAWKKRAEEAKAAGIPPAQTGKWEWTLNWNEVDPMILVGSCPRSPSDVDRLVDEAGIQAIICLQSDDCFKALKIDWPAIRERALERGVVMSRVAVRDFDHNDQANMLPEAVRLLAGHQNDNRRTYVHCTAGINRATLTVVGYLTFLQGMELDDAVCLIKHKRPVAHPYIDCWQTVNRRLLENRSEELGWMSKTIYEERCVSGEHGDSTSDWKIAEKRYIRETFKRRIGVDAHVTSSIAAIADMKVEAAMSEVEAARSEIEAARSEAEEASIIVQELKDAKDRAEMQLWKAKQELWQATEALTAEGEARAQLAAMQEEITATQEAGRQRAETAEHLAHALQQQAVALKEEMRALRAINAQQTLEISLRTKSTYDEGALVYDI